MNIGSSGSGSGSSNYSQSQRAEAERWLNIAQKLLTARDLHGTKTFAIRARESDPRLDTANQILAVADTLLAAESRVVISGNANQFDWYAILQLGRLTHSIELVATQYRKLALLLSPDRNRFPFADQAFKLVCEAWSVLSNPSKKSSYDTELQLSQLAQLGHHHQQQQQQQTPPSTTPTPTPTPTPPARKSPKPPAKDDKTVTEEDERPSLNHQTGSQQPSFWTACPYCYILYEYPKVYEDCTLRCQNCKRAFHGVTIASPPPVTGNGEYFCCWGYFPLGFNGNVKNMNSNWSPISAMFACPVGNGNVGNAKEGNNNVSRKPAAARPRVYYDDDDDDDDDDLYVEVSDDDDDDDDEWENETRKKKAKSVKGKESVRRNVGSGGGGGMQPHVVLGLGNAETNRRGLVGSSGRKQMAKGMKDLGKLDLNVEFSNEVEDPVPGMSEGNENGNGNGNREEDNIEGIGFFEGLDEFLSSLPILNVVGDDKVKAN